MVFIDSGDILKAAKVNSNLTLIKTLGQLKHQPTLTFTSH